MRIAHRSDPPAAMPEAPITTIGVIRENRGGQDMAFFVELPNGKVVTGHLPRRLSALAGELVPGDHVHLEMTPYDFEKARIAGRATS